MPHFLSKFDEVRSHPWESVRKFDPLKNGRRKCAKSSITPPYRFEHVTPGKIYQIINNSATHCPITVKVWHHGELSVPEVAEFWKKSTSGLKQDGGQPTNFQPLNRNNSAVARILCDFGQIWNVGALCPRRSSMKEIHLPWSPTGVGVRPQILNV